MIVSSEMRFTHQQKTTEMRKDGGDCFKMLVPKNLIDLHVLVKISTNTGLTFVNWVTKFILLSFSFSIYYQSAHIVHINY